MLDMLQERPEHRDLHRGERRDAAGVGGHPRGHSVQQMLALASVGGHRLHHPQREDTEPPLVRARPGRCERAAERHQRLGEARGQAGREHAEGDRGGSFDLGDHEVLERVREEHARVVALELVGRPLEVHERVLGQLAHHAREQARPGWGSATAATEDDDVDAERLAGQLELRDALVPALGEHVLQERDEHRVPGGVDANTPLSLRGSNLARRRRAVALRHQEQRYHDRRRPATSWRGAVTSATTSLCPAAFPPASGVGRQQPSATRSGAERQIERRREAPSDPI
ncbi:hypothetical protein WME90_02675 [Sorangium sp. So ce375]|uniref:hypothetical protein n=1 Tax=Sorangium sp. So ce375 TaxID=3133306 RepID=UPI003F5C03B7